jgi:hypothetical protein
MTRLILAISIVFATASAAFGQLSMDNLVSVELVQPLPPEPPRPACPVPCKRVAVIFVHGITGDLTTWKHKDAQADWPQMLASDKDLQTENEIETQLDVYRVTYYSQLNEGPSVNAISQELGRRLDDKLFRNQYSKIVMVCHSLGGLLCREHLLHVKLRWGHAYLSLFRATFTFGTPLQGSNEAERWIVRASSNEQTRVLRMIDVNDFLQLLNKSAQEFTDKRDTLRCPELKLYAGYEKLETPYLENVPLSPKALFVPRASATFGVVEERQKGFDADHRQLVKPRDRGDLSYQWVSLMLRECKPGLGGSCTAPIDASCGRPPWL